MSEFRRIYPNTGRILNDGGKNNKFPATIILDNESPDCANVVIADGAVGTREGIQKLNTQAIGSFVGDGLYTRRAMTGAETMIAFAGGSAWQLAGTTFTTIASAQSVFTAGVRVATAQYENHLFVGNGGVIPYKYNGTDWTRHGVYPPTVTFTAATAPTGTGLTGAYSYKMSWVNSQAAEGDVGPVSNTFTAANENIRLTSLPVAPQSFGVSSRRLYRTEAGGTTYKRVVEIADNTTTTYDDAKADGNLGSNAPIDKGVPPKYNTIVYHQNRLFMNDVDNPNFWWYTDLGEPYTVASTNFLQIGDSSTDNVKAQGVYDNSVFVICERSPWIVYMPDTTPGNWKVIKSKAAIGTKSPHAISNYDNKLFVPAIENGKFVGFAALSGDSVEPSASLLTISSAGSTLKSDRIEPDMFDVQESFLQNISSIVYKNKIYATFTFDSPNIVNNRVYVMDFGISNLKKSQKEAWIPWTGINASQFTVYNGSLYYISSIANGFVYKATDTGVYNDDGAAINSYYYTKEFSGFANETSYHKDWRYINMLIDTAGDYFMNLNYKVDSDVGSGNTIPIDLNPGGSLWGSMRWGIDMWGGGSMQRDHKQSLGGARGERIQFMFSNQNTVNQRFKVHGIRFTYNLKGYR
jgi:hypothetical protein